MSPELLPYIGVIVGELVKLLEYSGGLMIRLWICLYKVVISRLPLWVSIFNILLFSNELQC
jgi:hypothetical protein